MVTAASCRQAPAKIDPPVAVYAAWEGAWEGSFVGWNLRGDELYRIRVRQEYRTLNDSEQEVRIEDRMPDGSVVTGRGTNVARRRGDGSLELRCRVTKSTGERVAHEGRLLVGPDGKREILWFSKAPGRSESFREGVRRERGGATYFIQGFGVYAGKPMLMAGRYESVDR